MTTRADGDATSTGPSKSPAGQLTKAQAAERLDVSVGAMEELIDSATLSVLVTEGQPDMLSAAAIDDLARRRSGRWTTEHH